MNAALRLLLIPTCWKHSVIVPIPKANKDPTKLNNLIAITVLSGIILERKTGRLRGRIEVYAKMSIWVQLEQVANFIHQEETAQQLCRQSLPCVKKTYGNPYLGNYINC